MANLVISELGVGMVYAPSLLPVLKAGADLFDVIEIEPQVFWAKTGDDACLYKQNTAELVNICALPQKKIVHGVTLPIGGCAKPDPAQVAAFKDTILKIDALWASEHLSFNRIQGKNGFNTGFFLPPLQTTDGVAIAVKQIKHLQKQLPVPFAFEIGVNYLQPQDGEMPDGLFFKEVAEKADCGILLDLHNLLCNERNGRARIKDVLSELPLERVWEIHLADGKSLNGLWIDSHSGLICEELFEIAETIVPTLPNLKAIIFEIMEPYIEMQKLQMHDFIKQGERMRAIWDTRNTMSQSPSLDAKPNHKTEYTCSINAKEWQVILGNIVINRPINNAKAEKIINDVGISVYKSLIESVRGGTAISTLTLTTRLIRLVKGEDAFQNILSAFWLSAPPEPFPGVEAKNLIEFLRNLDLKIEYLTDVLAFEEYLLQASVNPEITKPEFSPYLVSLVGSLSSGILPQKGASPHL